MQAKSPNQVISPSGGVSVIRAGIVTGKASLFVLGGYGAAELGSQALRLGFAQAAQFAAKGTVQAMVVKAVPGLVAMLLLVGVTFKGALSRGASRNEAAGMAARVAVLMGIGVGASVLRDPIAQGMATLTQRMSAMFSKQLAVQPNKAAGNNLGAGGGQFVLRSGAMDEDGTGMFFNGQGQQLVYGGTSETVMRSGGDSGFQAPDGIINTANVMKTESW